MCMGCYKSKGKKNVVRGPWEKWWAWYPVRIDSYWYWREWVIRSHWMYDSCEVSIGGWTYDVVTKWNEKRSYDKEIRKIGWWTCLCMKILGSK